MDEEASVLSRRHSNGCAQLILNRPSALNSLTEEMLQIIERHLLAWEIDDSVEIVLITSACAKAFCAGGDIKSLASRAHNGVEASNFFRMEYYIDYLVHRYPKPIVSVWDGITMGGGVGLSIGSRYRIATPNTIWAMPENAIGLLPDVGASFFLSRCPGSIGEMLSLTGYRCTAADLIYCGLATHFVKRDKLALLVHELQSGYVRSLPDLLAQFSSNPGTSLLHQHQQEIDRCFSGETVAAIISSLEQHNSSWIQGLLKSLRRDCPSSIKMALHMLRLGRNSTLEDVFRNEFRVLVRWISCSDFREGVRAMVIDKDKNPRWKPACSEQVLEEMLQPLKGLDVEEVECVLWLQTQRQRVRTIAPVSAL